MYFRLTPTADVLHQIQSQYIDISKKTRIFVDFRNGLPFYSEHLIRDMLKDPSLALSSLLNSIFSFMNFVRYHLQDNTIEFIYFFDSGESRYHFNIDKDYKKERKQIKLDLKDEEIDTAKGLNDHFIDLFYRVSKLLPYTYSVYLKYFESDFVPYIVINELTQDKYNNIIISSDKDMYQLLTPDYSVILIKKYFSIKERRSITKLITFDNMYNDLLKKENLKYTLPRNDNFIVDLLSIAGDSVDGIIGVPRMGYISAYNILAKYQKHIEDLLEFDPSVKDSLLEKLKEYKEQILKNKKLVDFKEISHNVGLSGLKQIQEDLQKREVIQDTKDLVPILFEVKIQVDQEELDKYLNLRKNIHTSSQVQQSKKLRALIW